ALLEQETLNEAELAEGFKPIIKREPRPVWLSSQSRAVSDIPPGSVPTKVEVPAGEVTGTPEPGPTHVPDNNITDAPTPPHAEPQDECAAARRSRIHERP